MNMLTVFLYGEVPLAPVLMAVALVVAFAGSVGVGLYVFLHTPERFAAVHEAETPSQEQPPHAA